MSKKHLAILALTALALNGCGDLTPRQDIPIPQDTSAAYLVVVQDGKPSTQAMLRALAASGWRSCGEVKLDGWFSRYVLTQRKEGR